MKMGRINAGILVSLALAAPSWASPLFSDAPENHWASDAVRELAGRGIIQGYSDGTFQGARCLTRWRGRILPPFRHSTTSGRWRNFPRLK